jgi:hypothetical protein
MRGRGRGGELPPELLNVGVVSASTPSQSAAPALVLEAQPEPAAEKAAPAKRAGRAAKTARAKKTAAPAAAAETKEPKPRRPRAKKTAGATEGEG